MLLIVLTVSFLTKANVLQHVAELYCPQAVFPSGAWEYGKYSWCARNVHLNAYLHSQWSPTRNFVWFAPRLCSTQSQQEEHYKQ